jgi:hypothetical protein
MKSKSKLNKIKSIRELSLYRQNLEFQEKVLEQKVVGISADLADNFTDKLRDFTFNITSRLITQMFSRKKAKKDL